MYSFIFSMFHSVTAIGTVTSLAIISGTPTSLILKVGSGEITVRAEKLTLLPARLLLKRPSFPLRRCANVLSGLPDLCLAGGTPLASLSKYVVTWYCNNSHKSSTIS